MAKTGLMTLQLKLDLHVLEERPFPMSKQSITHSKSLFLEQTLDYNLHLMPHNSQSKHFICTKLPLKDTRCLTALQKLLQTGMRFLRRFPRILKKKKKKKLFFPFHFLNRKFDSRMH